MSFLPMLVAMLVVAIGGVSLVVLGREWFRSRRVARFRHRLARHSALSDRLRDATSEADFDAALGELEAIPDPLVREALLDGVRESAPVATHDWLATAAERLGLVDHYVDELRDATSWETRALAAERLGRIGSAKGAVPLIDVIRNLKDEDQDVRGAALRALGRIRDPDALPDLIKVLGDPTFPPRIAEIIVLFGDAAVRPLLDELRNLENDIRRMWAAELLGWLGDDRAGIPLVDALGDVSPEVRAKAAGAIGKLREVRALDRLLEMLVSDPVPFVRTRVAQALGSIGHPKVIDYLVQVLKDPEWWVRVRAVEALEQIGTGASGALLIALEDDDAEIRTRAAMALERMGYVEDGLRIWEANGFRADIWKSLLSIGEAGVTEVMLDSLPRYEGRAKALLVRLLGDVGDPAAGPILRELLVTSDDPQLRSRVIGSLGKLGYQDALADILVCLRDEDEWVRNQAVDALSALDPGSHCDQLLRLVRDNLPDTRRAVCEVLGGLLGHDVLPAIRGLLQDPIPAVRAEALRAIRSHQDGKSETEVHPLLIDVSVEVRYEAALTLATIGTAASVVAILRSASSESDRVLSTLDAALERCHTTSFQELLDLCGPSRSRGATALVIEAAARATGNGRFSFVKRYRRSQDPWLRRRAVLALRGFETEAALFSLEGALEDPDASVREAAVTVAALSGRLIGSGALGAMRLDPSPSVRFHYALALGLNPDDASPEILSALCHDHSVSVRAASVMSLSLLDDLTHLRTLKDHFRDTALCEFARKAFVPSSIDPLVSHLMKKIEAKGRIESRLLLGGSQFELERDLIKRAQGARSPEDRAQSLSLCELVATGQSNPTALSILKNDPSPEVRARALDLLVRNSPNEEVAGVVASVMVDPHPPLRVKAARALAGIDHPDAMEALIHALDTSDRQLREAVTTSLSEHMKRDPKRAEELIAEIPSKKTQKIGLIWVLGKSRRSGALKALISLLEDDEEDVRASVIGAISKYRLGIVSRHLKKALADPGARVRAAAVNALSRIRSSDSGATMERMLADPDTFVRRRAAMALVRLDSDEVRRRIAGIEHEPEDLAPVWAAGGVFLGLLSSAVARHHPAAAKYLNELLPQEEAEVAVRRAVDPVDRRRAFRVLRAVSQEAAYAAAQGLVNDPSIELREEAAAVVRKQAA